MRQVEAAVIRRRVEKALNLPARSLDIGTRGAQRVAFARQVAIWLRWRTGSGMTWTALGREFGRDRSTARYAVAQVCGARHTSQFWFETTEDLLSQLLSKD